MNPLAQTRSSGPPSSGDGDSTRRIGRFELLEEIGKGSMGIVYLARDPMIGRWVAVKKLTGIKGKLIEPEVVRRLLINEARNVGALEHPGIVTVFDVVEDAEGRVEALAMEYVAGKSLRQRLNEPDPLSLNYANQVVSAVAEVLDHAHENGCIHRDVKPANVLLAHDGAIKVADFGIAALRGEDLASELRNLGTPNYLAPERVMGQPGDQHTDIYSLGVILYELLTRHLPFEASSIAELVQKIVQEDPTPPETYVPDLMPGLRDILRRALAKEPLERYARAGDLAADLREIVEAQASMNDTVPAPMTPRPVAVDEVPLEMPASAPDPEPEPQLELEADAVRGRTTEPRLDFEQEVADQLDESLAPFEPDAPPADEMEAPILTEPEAEMEPAAAPEPVAPVEVVEWEMSEPEVASSETAAAPILQPEEPAVSRWMTALADGFQRTARLGAVWARKAVSRSLTAVASFKRSLGPMRHSLHNRSILAAAGVFALTLPILLLVMGGDSATRSGGSAAHLESPDRFQYFALLEESRFLRESGQTSPAEDALRRAGALLPETRDEVRREVLLGVAAAQELERLDRVEALTEQAHLQIARVDLAGARESIRELTELGAPDEILELLDSSMAQSRDRLRRARRLREKAEEDVAVVEPPVVAPVVKPAVVRRPPPKTGPGALEVEFSSARSRGVLTVYSSGRQILNRPYRFVEKKNFLVRKGISGSFRETVELPEGGHDLKIYLSQPKHETQLEPLTVTIPPGETTILRLRVQADGRFVVGSR